MKGDIRVSAEVIGQTRETIKVLQQTVEANALAVTPTVEQFEQIQKLAPSIRQQAVESTAMPLGNATRMTTQERQILGRWIAQGAKIP